MVCKQNNKKERLMYWQNMWTDEDNAKLIQLDKEGKKVRDIALLMNKSKNSVAREIVTGKPSFYFCSLIGQYP